MYDGRTTSKIMTHLGNDGNYFFPNVKAMVATIIQAPF